MRKLIAFLSLSVLLASCSLFKSLSAEKAQGISYYSYKLSSVAIESAVVGHLAVQAAKDGAYDSVIAYISELDSLYVEAAIYKDSLDYYVKEK